MKEKRRSAHAHPSRDCPEPARRRRKQGAAALWKDAPARHIGGSLHRARRRRCDGGRRDGGERLACKAPFGLRVSGGTFLGDPRGQRAFHRQLPDGDGPAGAPHHARTAAT